MSDFCHNCFAEIQDEKCSICGYVSKAEHDDELALPPGTVLNGRYKLGRQLGSGGFGITYKALDQETGIVLGIKEYVPMHLVYRDFGTNCLEIKKHSNKEGFEEGLLAFVEEANYLVLLKSCMRVVDIFSCFNENNTAYFTMEFLDGYALSQVPNMTYGLAYDCMIKTASALEIVHNRGIIHRDVSPQNIFLLKNNTLKMIDFGNARYINKENHNDERLVLKPGFAPPELYMRKNVQGPWTDIYSLAATFYRIVTKTKVPDALKRIEGMPLVPIRKYVPNIDYNVEMALNRALELDYDKRQRSIKEFMQDLRSYSQDNQDFTEVFMPPPAEEKPKPQKIVNIAAPKNNRPARTTGRFEQIPLNAKIIAYDKRKYAISDIKPIVIGRDPSKSHIYISDAGVSRRHCIIECNVVRGEFYLTDWSSNGTYLAGGQRIGYGTKYTLPAGSEFYVSSRRYSFKVVIE